MRQHMFVFADFALLLASYTHCTHIKRVFLRSWMRDAYLGLHPGRRAAACIAEFHVASWTRGCVKRRAIRILFVRFTMLLG